MSDLQMHLYLAKQGQTYGTVHLRSTRFEVWFAFQCFQVLSSLRTNPECCNGGQESISSTSGPQAESLILRREVILEKVKFLSIILNTFSMLIHKLHLLHCRYETFALF
jgi:hypothetical protein